MKKVKVRFISWKRKHLRQPLRHFLGNRNVKDRLFCCVFERDRRALLELYNALNGTNYQDEQALQIVTLDNVVYMSMNNDLAVVLMGTLELYEHQSTLCPNLPLRLLLYIAAEFESLVTKMGANIYGSRLVKLPSPRCVVFYNGDEELENSDEEQTLRLTDAFTDGNDSGRESCMELRVRVLNINYGHNKELMANCHRLKEYSMFVAKLKESRQRCGSMDEAVDNAVEYCIAHGIMEDILRPMRAEVKKMLLTEYDEKKTMKLFQKEAMEIGEQRGIQIGERRGEQRGEDTFAVLADSLLREKRITDLQRAIDDKKYRNALYREYGLKK